MPTQFQNIEAVTKQIQDNEVVQQYNDEALFLNEFVDRKPGKWVNGKGYEITSEFTPDPSHGYISAGGANPAGGSNEYAKMYVGYSRYRKTIDLDNDTLDDLLNGNSDTLLDFAGKIQRVTASGIRELEEACWGDGTGIKAVVGSGSTTTSIVLTTTPTSTPFTSKGAEFLYKNVSYDWYNASGTLQEANITASAVTKGTSPTLTPASTLSGSPSATDILVIAGSYNKVHRGMRYLYGNGSGLKQGLLMSAYDELKTPQLDLAGAPLQPSDILRLRNRIRYRSGVKAGKGMMLVGSITQIEAYARTGFNFLQLGVGQTWDGVVNKVQMGGLTPMELTTCDEDTLWFINGDDIGKIEKMPWGFIPTKSGQIWHQKSGSNGVGSDGQYATMGTNLNLYTKKPNTGGVIIRASTTGLSTSANAR